jgi:predicted DsbA family dithiol-disulfide isomerase
VEFADYECPHCGMMAPIMEKVYAQFPGNARFLYKFMPLSVHPHGEISARAGVAAIRQGKFWEMNEKMFKNQSHLEETNLLDYAKELGMDPVRFKADMNSPETADRLAKDKKLSNDLDIKGTPTIYINGRLFESGANPETSLVEWLSLDLMLRGITQKAPAAAAGNLAPTSGSTKDAGASLLMLDGGKSAKAAGTGSGAGAATVK